MAIRYDKQLNDRLNRAVKRFNAKLSYQASKGTKYLPEKVSVKQLKSSFSNRRKLLTEIKSLERFSVKGSTDSVKLGDFYVTKWEKQKLERQRAAALAQNTRELNRLNQKIEGGGLKYPARVKSFKSAVESNRKRLLRPISELTISRKESFERSVEDERERLRKAKIFRDNLAEQIIDKLGYANGYDKELLDQVDKRIRSMSPAEFRDFYEENPSIADIASYYQNLTNPKATVDIDEIVEFLERTKGTDEASYDDKGKIADLLNLIPE